MRTKVFAYKGWVGIESDVKAEGLLNNPKEKGQLGFVIDVSFIDITPEALELLNKVQKSGDDIGDIDLWESDSRVIFAWLGGPLKMFQPHSITGSRTYDASLIKNTVEIDIDPAFKSVVDDANKSKVV